MPDLPLSAGELVQMRHTVETYLAGTAILQNRTVVADGQGGQVETYTPAGTVAALLAPISGNEAELAGRLGINATFMLTLPSSATVALTTRAVYAGTTYEVTFVKDWDPYNIHQRVCVSEVA